VFALEGGGVLALCTPDQSVPAVGDNSAFSCSVRVLDAKGAGKAVTSSGCGMLAVHPI